MYNYCILSIVNEFLFKDTAVRAALLTAGIKHMYNVLDRINERMVIRLIYVWIGLIVFFIIIIIRFIYI